MKRLRLILLPFLFLSWAGCGNPPSGGGSPIEDPAGKPPAVKKIILAPDAQHLLVEEEKTVAIHILDDAGKPVADIPLTWSVSDPRIAEVAAGGRIKGLAIGRTTVTASYQEILSNTVAVEVLPSGPAVIELDLSPTEIKLGSNRPFTATVLDAAGHTLDAEVSWSIADPQIASVTPEGVVTGLQEGTTTLTATIGEIQSEPVPIVVIADSSILPVASIEIFPATPPTIEVGGTFPFAAAARDSAGKEVEEISFTWTVLNPLVASVDSNGTVTAMKEGNTLLTASSNEVASPAVQITVASPPPTPQVTGFYPAARGVATPEGRPMATFNTAMDFNSLQTGFTIQSTAGPVPGTVQCNTPCTTATFVPGALLTDGPYTALVSAGVKSDEGVALPAPFDWPFEIRGRTAASCGPAPRETNGWEIIRGQEPLQDLWGVHFINECEGWAVGMEMTFAHTMDGGVTWERQNNIVWKENNVPQIPPDVYDVFFLDANTGWAAGWPEVIFATTDGGATWREQRRNAAYTQDICLATNPATGACTKKNWCDSPDPEDPKNCLGKKSGTYLRRIRFADPQNGWVVGRFGTLYRTINGGATWTNPPQRPQNPVPCLDGSGKQRQFYTPHWFALDVVSSQEIWIGGGWDDGTYCTGWNRAIIHTTDGGASWIYQNDHPNFGALGGSGRYQDIRLIGNFGWAVGEVGTILRTTDHGATWQRISGVGAGGSTLWGLSLVDPMNIWITGSNGLVLHSANADAPTLGEIVWVRQESGTGTQLRRSSFVNPSFGWVAGQFRLFRTTTGGGPLPPQGP